MIEILRNTRFLFDVNNVVMIEILRNTRIFFVRIARISKPKPLPGPIFSQPTSPFNLFLVQSPPRRDCKMYATPGKLYPTVRPSQLYPDTGPNR
jgi:hypothetical protein